MPIDATDLQVTPSPIHQGDNDVNLSFQGMIDDIHNPVNCTFTLPDDADANWRVNGELSKSFSKNITFPGSADECSTDGVIVVAAKPSSIISCTITLSAKDTGGCTSGCQDTITIE